MRFFRQLLIPLAITLAGCGTAINGNHTDSDSGASVDSGAADASFDANTICDEQDFAIDVVPTKLLLALDMSGSMAIQNNYAPARTAITNAITNLSGLFHFGFNSYPAYPYTSANQCSISSTALFDTIPGNEAGIIAWLAAHEAISGAGDPLVIQMDAILNTPGYATNFTSIASGGQPYLVIISDGDDCCGPSGDYGCQNVWTTELVARTQQLLAQGIKTIVIGYSGADDATMTAIAAAGGSPFSTFLPAADQTALQTALETIGSTVASCTFAVDVPDTANRDDVNLYVDGLLLPYEPGCSTDIGWDWTDAEHTAIRLCATPCEGLRTETIGSINATFGCPSGQIE